jgi:elongation of very long chain fatty acids protein 4
MSTIISSSNGRCGNNEPSMAARYTTASLFTALLSTWTYYAFHPPQNSISTNDDEAPPSMMMIHGPLTPLLLTTLYLTSLPLLKYVTTHHLDIRYDMKTLLIESMILYNIAQVVFNGWMVYTICIALLYNDHPILGSRELIGPAINSGATRAVYVHYCDKYLEFVDTYFMILRGKMDQVNSI